MTEAGFRRVDRLLKFARQAIERAGDLAFAEHDDVVLRDLTTLSEAVKDTIEIVRLECDSTGQEA